jgi:hypothetical protein
MSSLSMSLRLFIAALLVSSSVAGQDASSNPDSGAIASFAPEESCDAAMLVAIIGDGSEPAASNAIDITAQKGDTVTFNVEELKKKYDVAVDLHDADDGSSGCQAADTTSYNSQCYREFSPVNLYLYEKGSMPLEFGAACVEPSSASSLEVIVYRFELPCEPCSASTAPVSMVQVLGTNLRQQISNAR